VAIVFGIAFTLGKGMRRISRKVTYGQIDTFLVLPKSVLWQVIFSEVEVSAVGDFFFGVLLLVLYAVVSSFGIGQILLLPLLVVFGVCSIAGFTIATQSLAFWFPNTEDLSNSLFEFMLGPSLYPNSSFTGGVRFFFVFVIPAIVIGGLPVDILLRLDLRDVLLLVGLSAFWLVVGVVVFYRGLRRYESGNLVGVR